MFQSCPTPCDPVDCSPPGSSVHEILQARILEWVATPFPGDLPDLRIKPAVLISPASSGGFFTSNATCKAHTYLLKLLWEKINNFIWSAYLKAPFVLYLKFRFLKFIYSFISISWSLITSQHCSGFCHTLTWISHGVTCVPHPDPPTHLPLHPIPLGLPSAPGQSTCLMHPTWAGVLFHYR